MSDQPGQPGSQPENKKNDTGSPKSGGPVFVAVGRLRRPHGVAGEIVMEVLTDFPERLRRGRVLYLGESHTPMKLDSIRPHGDGLLVAFEGQNDREEIGKFRNVMVYTKATALPELPEGEYYHHQILGLQVVNEAGQVLGILKEVLETGANDVYVVTPPSGPEILLPVIDSVILSIDLAKKQITVRPPEWLD